MNPDYYMDFTKDLPEDFDQDEYNAYLDDLELYSGEQEMPEDY